jgi:uncharacterized membrane protein
VVLLSHLVFWLRPVQGDEAYAYIKYITCPLWDTISLYAPNNHILYNLSAKIFCALCGNTIYAARLPAFIVGLIILPLNYKFIFLLYKSRRAAFLATMFLFSFPVFINYSVAARGYIFLILFTLISFYCLLKLMRGASAKWWFFYVGSSALGIYAIPVMVYSIFAGLLWFFLSLDGFRRAQSMVPLLRALAAIAFLAVLLYFPIIMRSGVGTVVANPFIRPEPLPKILRGLFSLPLGLYREWRSFLPLPYIFLLLAGFIAALFMPSKHRMRNAGLIAAIVIAVLAVTFVVFKPPYLRALVFALPFYAAAAAYGVVRVCASVRLNFYFAAFIVFVSVQAYILFSPLASAADLKSAPEIMVAVTSLLKPGDLIMASTPADAVLPFYFYINKISLNYFRDKESYGRNIFVVIKNNPGNSGGFDENILRNYAAKASKTFILKDATVYLFSR